MSSAPTSTPSLPPPSVPAFRLQQIHRHPSPDVPRRKRHHTSHSRQPNPLAPKLLWFVIPQRSGGICCGPCRCLSFWLVIPQPLLSFRSEAEESAFAFVVACSLLHQPKNRHLDRRRRILPPQRRDPCISLLPLFVLLFVVAFLFVIPQRSGGICCCLCRCLFCFLSLLFVCHSAAQRRNLLLHLPLPLSVLLNPPQTRPAFAEMTAPPQHQNPNLIRLQRQLHRDRLPRLIPYRHRRLHLPRRRIPLLHQLRIILKSHHRINRRPALIEERT